MTAFAVEYEQARAAAVDADRPFTRAYDLELEVAEGRRVIASLPDTRVDDRLLFADRLATLERRRDAAWAAEVAAGGAISLSPVVAALLERRQALDSLDVPNEALATDKNAQEMRAATPAEISAARELLDAEIAAVRMAELAELVAAPHGASENDEPFDELAAAEQLLLEDISRHEATLPTLALDARGTGDDAARARDILECEHAELERLRRDLGDVRAAKVERDRREQAAIDEAAVKRERIREEARDKAETAFAGAFDSWCGDLVSFGKRTRQLLTLQIAAIQSAKGDSGRPTPRSLDLLGQLAMIALQDAATFPTDGQTSAPLPLFMFGPLMAGYQNTLRDTYLAVPAAPSQRCKVCALDDETRTQVEDALRAGPLRDAESAFGISKATLSRHSRHMNR